VEKGKPWRVGVAARATASSGRTVNRMVADGFIAVFVDMKIILISAI
jgi:hypothetical protein